MATDEHDVVLGYAFCIFQQHIGDNILTDIKTLYIDDLCVDESLRGQHIGRQLYDAVVSNLLICSMSCSFAFRISIIVSPFCSSLPFCLPHLCEARIIIPNHFLIVNNFFKNFYIFFHFNTGQ